MTPEMSDPTQSGFTAPEKGTARLSATETETLCQKAARGAGLSWGMAEEAGFAARWLYVRGLAGPEALLDVLDRFAETAPLDVAALRQNTPSPAPLSPIDLGAALSDFADLLPSDLHPGSVLRPVLLLPFIHHLARLTGHVQTLNWPESKATVTPEGAINGDIAELADIDRATITISPTDLPADNAAPEKASSPLDARTIARLNDYAMRTTVPATASSRADAGSAEGDND